ncbi:phenylalanine--tRNA ligase subunit alpha [Fundicoccus culcitae]|uniref:Phenylalanine--tRNA ligase alpha subunit n=1 Tax=Fundicoccus culcitae TaxID=2969821 RepID=A0ABY5P9J7_9LACT|nr:phenylalanine--tRNA ligase subunit alpha [Fundicoccus culcitae]UUX35436.1 phenylalanine--tRNA ligase subunit alpha [Fundicoccus culcitae]
MEATASTDLEASQTLKALDQVRIKYIGKKGHLTDVSKAMKALSNEERPLLGQAMNQFKDMFNQHFEKRKTELEEQALIETLAAEKIDVTLPGRQAARGSRHIITQIMEEIEDLFIGMGYQVIEGPEVETDSYNFEKMNLPKNHPARDMQDTFYVDEETLLRTHTSPVQARTMEQHNFEKDGPLKMISPGKVFRRDTDDATHSHQFHQIEGLVVDEKITLADLKGTLLQFVQALFGEERDIRLRPSYFPFTEPSVEVDVSCFKCGGEGCSVCKQTGWIEILGAGVVHPHVLEMSGIDPNKYSGFAFGLGQERVAMLKYNVDDIRHFYQNDLRFLTQFKGGDY